MLNDKSIVNSPQIRSDTSTCVAFKAVRTFVVGRVQPVAVTVYDYYEPSKYDISKILGTRCTSVLHAVSAPSDLRYSPTILTCIRRRHNIMIDNVTQNLH